MILTSANYTDSIRIRSRIGRMWSWTFGALSVWLSVSLGSSTPCSRTGAVKRSRRNLSRSTSASARLTSIATRKKNSALLKPMKRKEFRESFGYCPECYHLDLRSFLKILGGGTFIAIGKNT